MAQADAVGSSIDSLDPLSVQDASSITRRIINQMRKAVVADDEFFEELLTTVIARGHVHLEDVPGTGKTVAAQVLSQALGVSFSRVQFTPDLLPADITGSHVYNEHEADFEFKPGPVFANVVLADEINRAPPKTQAALLEAMGEGQVSIDGTSYELPSPFFVIATQNPVEQEGTFELPEAQRDRFSIKTDIGYPDRGGEQELLERRSNRRHQLPSVENVCDTETVQRLQVTAEGITVADEVRNYIIDIARSTRDDHRIDVGVSPRGIQKLFETSRALALIRGRDYVTPDDVKRLTSVVFAHRLVLTTDAAVRNVRPSTVVSKIVDSVSVPGMGS